MFGEFLLMHGIIDNHQLSEALEKQGSYGLMLGETLVSLGYITQEILDQKLQEHLLHRADEIVNDPEIALFQAAE